MSAADPKQTLIRQSFRRDLQSDDFHRGAAAGAASFAGTWAVNYAGSFQGQCSGLTIAASGSITGNCTNNTNGSIFPIAGTVTNEGEIDFANAQLQIRFDSQLSNGTANGVWEVDNSDAEGNWTMTRS